MQQEAAKRLKVRKRVRTKKIMINKNKKEKIKINNQSQIQRQFKKKNQEIKRKTKTTLKKEVYDNFTEIKYNKITHRFVVFLLYESKSKNINQQEKINRS